MRWRGIVEILLSGFCFGFLGLFGKIAYSQGISSGEFLSFRFLLSASLLACFFLFFQWKKFLLTWQSIMHCGLLGIFGYAVFSSCFFRALQGLSASLTVLLLYTYPVFVLLGSRFLFKEELPLYKWLALPLQFIGLLMLVGLDISSVDIISLLFGLGSAFFYALYILASSKLLKGVSPWSSVFYIQFFAAIALSLIYFDNINRVKEVFFHSYPVLIGTAVIGTLMAMSLFLSALQKLKSYEASILSTAEPLTGIVLAMVFLREHLSLPQLMGAILILGAMIIVSWKKTIKAKIV